MRYKGELVHTETDARGIGYRLYIQPDDLEVWGNALASGDDAEDKRYEDEIIARLKNGGDVWAWAQVSVEARYKGFSGWDYLGGCSYKDTADFVEPGGYYDYMKSEALSQLCHDLIEAAKVAAELNGVL
jgi:hypothetical protein